VLVNLFEALRQAQGTFRVGAFSSISSRRFDRGVSGDTFLSTSPRPFDRLRGRFRWGVVVDLVEVPRKVRGM
jgi:hypothetical protein